MKIALVSREYPLTSGSGGIGTYTYNLAHALVAHGHEVHVITRSNKTRKKDKKVLLHTIKHNDCFCSNIRYSCKVAKILRKEKFDIVQASEWGGEAYIFSLFKNAPLVTRFATPTYMINRLNNQKDVGFLTLHMERAQAKHSNALFSSTHALAEVIAVDWKINIEKIKVIPNSIELKNITNQKTKQLFGKDYILYFGRLEERKGMITLAKALSGVFKKYPDIKVVLAGKDMSYRNAKMSDYIKEKNKKYLKNIIFTGDLKKDKMYSVIAASQLVVLPSRWEAFGFVCLEALAFGKVTIATKGSGFSEIIEDSVSGYLVNPDKPKELTQKIIHCLSNDMSLIRRNARARSKRFSVENISKQVLELYENMVK